MNLIKVFKIVTIPIRLGLVLICLPFVFILFSLDNKFDHLKTFWEDTKKYLLGEDPWLEGW